MKSTVFAAVLLWIGTDAHAAIQGLYGSECLQVEGLSAYKDMAFEGDTLKQVQTVFGDSECGTLAYDFTFEGPYVLDAKRGTIDYSFTKIKLTPLSEGVADNFNEYALCGLTNWKMGEAANVAGLDCGGQVIPHLETFVYDRIKETKDGLQMGLASDELNGATPEKRPAELDAVLYHAK